MKSKDETLSGVNFEGNMWFCRITATNLFCEIYIKTGSCKSGARTWCTDQQSIFGG